MRFIHFLRGGRRWLLALVLGAAASAAHAQTGSLNSYVIAPGTALGQGAKLLPWPGGRGYLLTGYSRYGFDSSVVNLIRLNARLEVGRHREYRLPRPLSYVFTASGLGATTWLLGGALSGGSTGSIPIIASTDTLFAPRWMVSFTNLTHSQNYVVKLLPQGPNAFTAYTYTDGGGSDGMYSITGNRAGTQFRGQLLTPSAATPGLLRVFEAIPSGVRPDEHLLVGTGRVTSPGSTRLGDALIMKLDSTGVQWSKLLDFGFDGESISSIVRTTDGNYVVPLVTYGVAGTAYPTVLCKLDPAGTLLWARQLSLPGMSLFLAQVVETAAGELVLCGIDENYALVAVKLTATGDLVWARSATGAGTYVGDLTRTPSGSFVMTGTFNLAQLDAAGNGCAFQPLPALTVAPASGLSSAAQNFPIAAAAFTPQTQAQTMVPRTQTITRNPSCIAVGVAEAVAPEPLRLWPNPATGAVRVSGLPADATELRLLDALGRTVRQQTCASVAELDLRGVAPGVYWVRAGTRTAQLVVE